MRLSLNITSSIITSYTSSLNGPSFHTKVVGKTWSSMILKSYLWSWYMWSLWQNNTTMFYIEGLIKGLSTFFIFSLIPEFLLPFRTWTSFNMIEISPNTSKSYASIQINLLGHLSRGNVQTIQTWLSREIPFYLKSEQLLNLLSLTLDLCLTNDSLLVPVILHINTILGNCILNRRIV